MLAWSALSPCLSKNLHAFFRGRSVQTNTPTTSDPQTFADDLNVLPVAASISNSVFSGTFKVEKTLSEEFTLFLMICYSFHLLERHVRILIQSKLKNLTSPSNIQSRMRLEQVAEFLRKILI